MSDTGMSLARLAIEPLSAVPTTPWASPRRSGTASIKNAFMAGSVNAHMAPSTTPTPNTSGMLRRNG